MRQRCALKQAVAARKKGEQELTEILTHAVMTGPATVVVTDVDGTIEYVNRKFSALTGYSPAEAVGQKASLLKSGLMPESGYRRLWRRLRKGEEWSGEFHNRKKNGEVYWEQASISPVRDAAGRVRHYLKLAEDITERKRLEAELQESLQTLRTHQAQLQATCTQLAATTRALKASKKKLQRQSQEDALTGLLNRRGFDAELQRLKALAERQGHCIGLLIIDIDHFKQINDRFGHAAGDRVLKGFAALLRARLRASDVICRYGGDELVVALPSSDAASTRRTGERILAAVRKHDFSSSKQPLPVTVSIGAACGIPAPGQSFEQVMKLADRALYRVKRNGRNGLAFWSPEEDASPLSAPSKSVPEKGADTCRPVFNLLLAMLDAREPATGAHCRRVARMAAVLARTLNLPNGQIDLLVQSALLHDIGKIAIPEALLLKPAPLTADERKAVQNHSRIGHGILQVCPELKALSDTVLDHHERLNGSGYPRRLRAKRISLGARILAVADTYDAIRAGRPYCAARSPQEALDEIQRCRGTHFDPDVVDALARCQDELDAVLKSDA